MQNRNPSMQNRHPSSNSVVRSAATLFPDDPPRFLARAARTPRHRSSGRPAPSCGFHVDNGPNGHAGERTVECAINRRRIRQGTPMEGLIKPALGRAWAAIASPGERRLTIQDLSRDEGS